MQYQSCVTDDTHLLYVYEDAGFGKYNVVAKIDYKYDDVAINDKGVDSSIAHGMGRAKAIAFASVPAVIEKGRQIDFVEKWKGRNYDSYVFAAPIRIGTQKAFVGVVVTKSDTDNRYYLHEVSDNEGNIIIIKKDDVSFKSKSEADNDNSSLGETSPTNNIPQEKEIVNTSQEQQEQYKTSNYEKADTDEQKLNNEPASDTMETSTQKNPVESEDNGNERGSNTLSGNSRRRNNGSARKQTERISSFERKNQGRDATERQRYTRELVERGQVEEVTVGNYKYTIIKPEAYNDDMLSMVEKAKNKGVELQFIVGKVRVGFDTKDEFTVRGLKLSSTKVVVQYDNDKSPQKISKHEIIHAKWNTPEIQEIKDTILNSLTEEDKQSILSQERYSRYLEMYKNDKDAVFEEFVCDVMSGITYYVADHIDMVNDYWYGNEELDSYNVAEYSESIDAGGNDAAKGRYDLSDEGGEHDEKRNISRGISGISKESGDKRGRDTSNKRNVPPGRAETLHQNKNSKPTESGNRGKRSSSGHLVRGLESLEASGKSSGNRQDTENRRFQQAIDNNDIVTANDMLNKKAVANGYIPVKVYKGTQSDKVRTVFDKGNAIWVTPDYDYASDYSNEYSGTDNEKSAQLHTEPNSNVYEFYAKYGNVLELGNIEQEINTLEEAKEFAKKVGITINEYFQCRLECKEEYGDDTPNEIWAITNTKRFAELAKNNGYDSLHALERNGIETYGILYPENVKSSKLKTYDDKGNLIPLSERFNEQNKDIRYDIDDEKSYAPTFYSQMGKVIDEIKQDKTGATGVSKDRYDLEEDSEFKSNKKSVEQYTKKDYLNFGWARANNILNAGEYSNFTSKFADAVENKFYFPKSKSGEFIIAVSDINEPIFRGIENVLVFADGKIDNPVINSIIRIYEYDETSLEKVRGYIYGLEHRGIHVESRKAFTRYYGSDFADGYYRGNSKDGGHNNVDGVGERNSTETQTTKEETKVRYDLEKEIATTKSNAKTKIKYSPTGIKLPANEYAKFYSSTSTDYYKSYKTHRGLQYQSCVTDDTHLLYVYEDAGFGKYNVVAKIDYKYDDVAKAITEELRNGEHYKITNLINEMLEMPEVRRSGYSLYNSYTKKRRSSGGVRSLSQRQSRSDTRGTDAGSGRVTRDERRVKTKRNADRSLNNESINPIESDDIRYDLDKENNLDTQKKIEKIAKEITSHEEFISLTKQNTQEFVDKIKENQSLQKRLDNAKRQMILSPKPSINIAKVGKVTKDIPYHRCLLLIDFMFCYGI